MAFKPTLEQERILEVYEKASLMKIEALAGTGKTSSLQMISQVKRVPTLYMAFNKAMATEAKGKFGSHVDCKTIHSLAHSEIGHKYSHKLSRPSGRYVNVAGTPKEVANYYNLPEEQAIYTNVRLASWIISTVDKFQMSDDKELSYIHINTTEIKAHLSKVLKRNDLQRIPCKSSIRTSDIKDIILKYAKKLWQDRINLNSPVLINHNTYLKLYQLSSPRLHYDLILLDEAQDVNPCMLSVFSQQFNHSTCILVGDTYQSIYMWNGAINALSKVSCTPTYLTKSFRFGQSIANIANKVLGGLVDMKGNESIDSVVGQVDKTKPYTKLFRTNSALMLEAVGLISSGEQVMIESNFSGFVNKLQQVLAMSEGNMKGVKHPDLIGYTSYDEFKEVVEYDPELKRMTDMVENNIADGIIETLSDYKNPSKCSIVFTTAHKAKGLEYKQVVMADDFLAGTCSNRPLSNEERNLLYVACTRAQEVLEINQVVNMCIEGTVIRGGSYDRD